MTCETQVVTLSDFVGKMKELMNGERGRERKRDCFKKQENRGDFKWVWAEKKDMYDCFAFTYLGKKERRI